MAKCDTNRSKRKPNAAKYRTVYEHDFKTVKLSRSMARRLRNFAKEYRGGDSSDIENLVKQSDRFVVTGWLPNWTYFGVAPFHTYVTEAEIKD